ncbi:UDP-N-acetylmuramyl peptide synthase [Bifidobacterium sp. ESL0745]|uniref:UDP-N-acetylmuramyl peptide synthase n=1 Tax=Bifidobacterium sp. ESL0745 TaxID=2983226 RepID=UPI0023F9F45F|nr:UDP-N-acetylmuramyl peptide synthase [Bifidobacterium sp. ESL0745]MDF7664683.1 UDP-N-acetylmuramyl peptide synthase [Bifidobacterium sp. ESL0745]
MSVVSESISRRVTLGYIAGHYGLNLEPKFADGVTVTSIADRPDSVRPGALFVLPSGGDSSLLSLAASRGAYAVLAPPAFASAAQSAGVPALLATVDKETMGALAADIAGTPANTMAVFVVCGRDDEEVQADVIRLADFLHMLGNPVGIVSASGSSSLERELEMTYPLGILDIQHTLAVCSEDGAAAMVIAADTQTLRPGALESVNVDVLGSIDILDRNQAAGTLEAMRQRYGFSIDERKHLVTCNEESGWLAGQTSISESLEGQRRLSLAIAMAMDAGVRRSNIRNALRVSKELQ